MNTNTSCKFEQTCQTQCNVLTVAYVYQIQDSRQLNKPCYRHITNGVILNVYQQQTMKTWQRRRFSLCFVFARNLNTHFLVLSLRNDPRTKRLVSKLFMLHISFSANALAKCQRFNWQIKSASVSTKTARTYVKWNEEYYYGVTWSVALERRQMSSSSEVRNIHHQPNELDLCMLLIFN